MHYKEGSLLIRKYGHTKTFLLLAFLLQSVKLSNKELDIFYEIINILDQDKSYLYRLKYDQDQQQGLFENFALLEIDVSCFHHLF